MGNVVFTRNSAVEQNEKYIPTINNLVAHNRSVFKGLSFKSNSPVKKMNGKFTSRTQLLHSIVTLLVSYSS